MIKLLRLFLSIALVLSISSCIKDIGNNFSVKVSKVTELPIDEVTFVIGDVTTSFGQFNEYGERRIYIPVQDESGTFDVVVAFTDGREIVLSAQEYRSGLGVYISVRDDAINYTKAHW